MKNIITSIFPLLIFGGLYQSYSFKPNLIEKRNNRYSRTEIRPYLNLNNAERNSFNEKFICKKKLCSDTLTNHFVRFLCFASPNESNANFSVSLKKMSPLSAETEPLVDVMNSYEKNFVVNDTIYLKFKRYVVQRRTALNQNVDNIRHQNFILEINIDSYHRYYLDDKQSITFINDFIKYLNKNKIKGQYYNILNWIVEKAKYNIKYPNRPNGDPN